MKTFLPRRIALGGAALVAGLTLSGGAQANLFDFLFGGPPEPAYSRPSYSRPGARPPLDVRVNPRRKAARPAFGPERGGAGPRARVGRFDNEPRRKAVTQRSIDPIKNPSWYLDDPTLRRGDIVVLKSGILVFDGGNKSRRREDFTSLDKSRLVSKADRERLQKSAPMVADSQEPALPAQKAASLQNSAQ